MKRLFWRLWCAAVHSADRQTGVDLGGGRWQVRCGVCGRVVREVRFREVSP